MKSNSNHCTNQISRHVAQTGTALDFGEPLARAGDPISSSFSQLAAGLDQIILTPDNSDPQIILPQIILTQIILPHK